MQRMFKKKSKTDLEIKASFKIRHYEPIEITMFDGYRVPEKMQFNKDFYIQILKHYKEFTDYCDRKTKLGIQDTHFNLFEVEIKIAGFLKDKVVYETFNDINQYADYVKKQFGWEMNKDYSNLKKLFAINQHGYNGILILNPYSVKQNQIPKPAYR